MHGFIFIIFKYTVTHAIFDVSFQKITAKIDKIKKRNNKDNYNNFSSRWIDV